MNREEYVRFLEEAKKSYANLTKSEISELYKSLNKYVEEANISKYYDVAIHYYEFLLEMVREIDNKWEEATLLNNMSNTYKYLERRDLALEALQKSLELRVKVGDIHGEFVTNMNIQILKSGK